MEESTQLQTLALEPSVSAYSFPRRLLRSRTYYALMPLLSHFRKGCQNPDIQGDTHGVDFRQVSEENGIISDGIKSTDVSAPSLILNEREDKLVHATVTGKTSENVGCRDGGFGDEHITVQESDCINLVMEKEQEAVQANISIADFIVDDNQTEDCAFQIVEGPNDMNTDPSLQMDDFGSMGQLELDTEFSLGDFSEVLNSSFDMDVAVESPIVVEVNKENCSVLEENMQIESEQQLQLKEMELEKLISKQREVDSYCFVDGNEIEEGEISGEAGVSDELLNELSKDATSLGDKTTETMHAFGDNVDEEAFTCNNKKRVRWGHDVSDPSVISIVNSGRDCKVGVLREAATRMQDNHYQNIFHHSQTETHRFGPALCLENLPPSGKTIQENADQNQVSAATDGDDGKKKRKKCTLTKERRAKKKRKERIKRAENNRKLGIKRLKLQPEVKPKTIKYCRHYLHGRCHEGEKCNFSHDVIPLTKSKPCCHFARRSCMKGDDCPFDHELSKYPCNNYASEGFCSRGSDCLFSHKIPAKESLSTTTSISTPNLNPEKCRIPEKEGSSTASKFSKPSVKLTSPLSNSCISKNAGNGGMFHQKSDNKLCSAGKTSDKNAEKLSEPVRIFRQAPKGVSFLLTGDTSKLRLDAAASPKAVDGVVNKTILKASVVETLRRPRGINFLSFAQKPPLDDTSCKTFSNLFSNGYNGKGKSVVGDFAESVNFNSEQMNQKATCTVQNLSEGSLGKIQLNDSASANTSKISLLSSTPRAVQKAVQSTLAFAAKFEHNIKLDHTFISGATSGGIF